MREGIDMIRLKTFVAGAERMNDAKRAVEELAHEWNSESVQLGVAFDVSHSCTSSRVVDRSPAQMPLDDAVQACDVLILVSDDSGFGHQTLAEMEIALKRFEAGAPVAIVVFELAGATLADDAGATLARENLDKAKQRMNGLRAYWHSPDSRDDLKRKCRGAFQDISQRALRRDGLGNRTIDLSRVDQYAPARLSGRSQERRQLRSDWRHMVDARPKRARVVGLVGWGGTGKTALVMRWALDQLERDKAGRACRSAFAWTFHGQGGPDAGVPSSELFLTEALTFFGDASAARSAMPAQEKGRQLAQLVGSGRSLLILDGIDPLLAVPEAGQEDARVRDVGLASLLTGLARANQGLCVFTSRLGVADLRPLGTGVRQRPLDQLSPPGAVQLLRRLGTQGPDHRLREVARRLGNHALTLTLVGSYVGEFLGGDPDGLDRTNLMDVDQRVAAGATLPAGHARRVLMAYRAALLQSQQALNRLAWSLLQALGLFDRPVHLWQIEMLTRQPVLPGINDGLIGVAESDLNAAGSLLLKLNLVTPEHDGAGKLQSLDIHPLIRDFLAEQLQADPTAWRAAHARIFDAMQTRTLQVPSNAQLDDLQPLYAAITHGCRAGKHQEAYQVLYERVQRGRMAYSQKRLGAFQDDLAAISTFYPLGWGSVPESLSKLEQGQLLARASFSLRALGRLKAAVEPACRSVELIEAEQAWAEASVAAGALSQLQLLLGDIAGAIRAGQTAVGFADRAREVHDGTEGLLAAQREQRAKQTILAEAYVAAGCHAEAEQAFATAEAVHVELEPGTGPLRALWGFRRLDAQLGLAQRMAWRRRMGLPVPFDSVTTLQRTLDRAELMVAAWNAGVCGGTPDTRSELDKGLERLAAAQVRLLRAMLAAEPGDTLCSPAEDDDLQCADTLLREAGQYDHLPRLLLPHATWCALAGATNARRHEAKAVELLNECMELARSGPMPLVQVDTLLTRVRLFARPGTRAYPWPTGARDDVKTASLLIDSTGYRRRRVELEEVDLWLPR